MTSSAKKVIAMAYLLARFKCLIWRRAAFSFFFFQNSLLKLYSKFDYKIQTTYWQTTTQLLLHTFLLKKERSIWPPSATVWVYKSTIIYKIGYLTPSTIIPVKINPSFKTTPVSLTRHLHVRPRHPPSLSLAHPRSQPWRYAAFMITPLSPLPSRSPTPLRASLHLSPARP